MWPNARRWFRNLLLSGIYALGVFGILASGDGDGDSVTQDFTCGLSVRGIAPVGDGTVWIGVFAKTNSDTEDRVVLLDTDGSELRSYSIGKGGTENAVRAVARATDGSNDIYIGGDFGGGILRLNDDGTPDGGFAVGMGFNGRVTSIVPVSTGEVYVGGFFDDYKNTPVTGFVRLLEDGDLDNTFGGLIIVGAAVDDVESIAMSGPLVSDDVYSGNAVLPQIKRWTGNGLEVGGYIDPMLGAGSVLSITPASILNPGEIYLGGTFGDGIIRLQGSGLSSGINFGTGFDAEVVSIALATALLPATEAIYVGGDFTAYDGNNSNGVARIISNGAFDGSFNVGTGFTDPNGVFPFSKVASVAEDIIFSDDVFVGGGFTEYNGVPSNGIVRLDTVGSPTAFDVSIDIDGEVCNSQTIPDS